MYSMNLLAPNAETLYFYSTILTFLSALAALGMEFLISIGLGFGETSFDFLIALTGFATVGLLAGGIRALSRRRWVPILLGISSGVFVLAYLILSLKDYTPPLAWWALFPVFVAQTYMSFVRFSQMKSSEVTPWPH